MRFALILSYNGAPFNGWQIQPSDPAVQQSLERALSLALRHNTAIVGAGRTDTGVNARYMVAHFDVPHQIGESLDTTDGQSKLIRTVNAIVRPAIAVYHCVKVSDDFHARFDALSRTYRYFIHTVPDPFRHDSSRFIHQKLDFGRMNHEAQDLLGTQDFTSFSKLHTDTKNNICTITEAKWVEYGPEHYYFEISANRFLRNMVRAIVGTLLDVGTGKATPGHVVNVINKLDRCSAGTSVPGYALYLWDIKYSITLPDAKVEI